MSIKHIPDGFHTVTPYLVVNGVDKLINFLQKVFDATVLERIIRHDGTVANSSVQIGNSIVMMADEKGEFKANPTSLYVYLEDTDAIYQKALEIGAKSLMEPNNMFYGDRNAGFLDPCGNSWWIATHFENLTEEEVQNRANAHFQTAG